MSRVPVVFLCQSLEVGGVEDLMLLLARRLPRERYDLTVLTMLAEGPVADELRAAGVPVRCLGTTLGWRHPLALARLVVTLRRARPRVLHTFHLTANLYGRLAGILARVPVIVATEANVLPHRRGRQRFLERLLGPFTWRVIANSRGVADAYRRWSGLHASKIVELEAPPDLERFAPRTARAEARARLGLRPNGLLVGVVASLSDKKGHAVLLDAVRRVPAGRAQVVVVGDGPLRESLVRAVEATGLGDVVQFVGMRRDLDVVFSALDIFVLPSLWEGMPLALLAAMAAGLPVVASAVGGVPEVVRDGVNGVLVPAADAAALARALGAVLDDAGLRERLGATARRTIEGRYDAQRFVDAVDALYRDGLAAAETRPRRILFVTDVADVGGASERFVRLARHAVDRGWAVRCVALTPPGPLTDDLRCAGLELTSLGIARGADYPLGFLRLVGILIRWRPTIVHAQLRYATFLSAVAGRLLGIRRIVSTRPYTAYPGKHRILDAISSRLVDAVFAVSASARDVVLREGAAPGKVTVIPNGVACGVGDRMEAREALRLRGTVIGTVGNLLPIKDQRPLVDGVARLVKEGYDVSLLIIGEGPLRGALEAAAARGGIANRVRLPGQLRPATRWLSAIDVFVLSSANEGMSNALLEAMAAARPVVATAVGGTPEVVVHGESGLLVPPGDPDALVDAVRRLLDDPALASRLGATAARHVEERFGLARMLDAYVGVYDALLAGRRP